DIAYRAQDLLAQQIVVDACGEDLVGLDEFGTQVQPAPQVGKTGPQVVDGELDAPRTQPGHDRGQIGPELALPLLGDLDHQAPGIQSASCQQRSQIQRSFVCVPQGHRADVQEQAARQRQRRETLDHHPAASVLYLDVQSASP